MQLGVEPAAVVGDLDDDVAAFVIGRQADAAVLGLAGRAPLAPAIPSRGRPNCAPYG